MQKVNLIFKLVIISRLCLSLGHKRIYIVGMAENGLKIIDLETKEIIAEKMPFEDWDENTLVDGFITDSRGNMAASCRKELIIFKEDQFRKLNKIEASDTFGGYSSSTRMLFYSERRRKAIWWAGLGEIRLIDLENMKTTDIFEGLFEEENEFLVESSLVEHGQKIIAITSGDDLKKIYLIDLKSKKINSEMEEANKNDIESEESRVRAFNFNSDRRIHYFLKISIRYTKLSLYKCKSFT